MQLFIYPDKVKKLKSTFLFPARLFIFSVVLNGSFCDFLVCVLPCGGSISSNMVRALKPTGLGRMVVRVHLDPLISVGP